MKKIHLVIYLGVLFLFAAVANAATFTESSSWGTNLQAAYLGSIAYGDIDNDGDLDLVLTGTPDDATDYSKVYLNTGSTLVESAAWGSNLTAMEYSSTALGDIDNDNDLDLILCGSESSLTYMYAYVYINNGTGFEQTSAWDSGMTGLADCSIALGDIDNDGDLDLGMNGYDDGWTVQSFIYANTGTSFAVNATWQGNISPSYAGEIEFVDIDGDNYLDLSFTGYDDVVPYGRIFMNNGTTFTESTAWQTSLAEVYWSSTAWGDIDNDGDLDLALTGWDDSAPIAKIYENTGSTLSESVTWQQELVPIYESSIAFGDVDNDGDLDLISTGKNGTIYSDIFINNGTTLEASGHYIPVDFGSVNFADVDNDGDLDLTVIGDNGTAKVAKVYLNDEAAGNANSAPAAPTEFLSSYSDGKLYLNWSGASDTETPTVGLYYNVRVGTVSGGNGTLSGTFGGHGKPAGGYLGNSMIGNSMILEVANSSYYWSVQTIDTSFERSSWSEEQYGLGASTQEVTQTDNSGNSFNITDDQGNEIATNESTPNVDTNLTVKDSTGKKIVEVEAQYSQGGVDLSNLVIEYNDNAVVVDFSSVSTNIAATHTLYYPNTGTGFTLCPEAKTLAEAKPGCANETLFTHYDIYNNLSKSIAGVYDVTATIDGSYYKVSGLTGTAITWAQNVSIITRVSVSNTPPTVDTVTLSDSDGSDMDLYPNSTVILNCSGTASDTDGWSTITINGTINSTVAAGSTDSYLNHYSNLSCATTQNTATVANYECTFVVWYNAIPGTWTCTIIVDDASTTASNTDEETMGQLMAIDVNEGDLDFGSLAVGASTTDSALDHSRNKSIYNQGNVVFDVNLKAYGDSGIGDNHSMSCTAGNITIDVLKYTFNTTAEAHNWTLMTPMVNGSGTDYNLSLPVSPDTSGTPANPVNTSWWTFSVPTSPIVSGDCSGTVLFSAISDT